MFMFFYALGEIVDQLISLNVNIKSKNNYKTSEEIKKSTVQVTANGNWICKKCKTENDSKALYCKDCGSYK